MKARLLLIACVLCLATSLSVPSAFLLNALEARLFLLGQTVMVWELYCRGESLKLLSVNIAAMCFLFSMCFNFSPTIPGEPTNVFIILALIYLGLTILIVDPLKHSRSLLASSSPPPVDPFDCIEWRQLPLYAPHIFRIVDPQTKKAACFSLFLWPSYTASFFTVMEILPSVIVKAVTAAIYPPFTKNKSI